MLLWEIMAFYTDLKKMRKITTYRVLCFRRPHVYEHLYENVVFSHRN